jgi:hypothetical protein
VHAFTFKHGTVPWPAGLRLLHAYVTADLARAPGLAALLASCRDATRGEPLAHVADEWLHITLCQIAVPARDVDAGQRVALAAEIGQALRVTEPFPVTTGGPFRAGSGVLLEITDNGWLAEVRDLVSAAAGAVMGAGLAVGNTAPLHMTESYACGDADDARVDAELLTVRPRQATLPVDVVDLVDVSADQAARKITWLPVARIPLGS